jgi:hypothetical protein
MACYSVAHVSDGEGCGRKEAENPVAIFFCTI